MGLVSSAALQGGAVAAQQALGDQRARQRAFLKRKMDAGTTGVNTSCWRPRKRFRKKGAYLWLSGVHNQIKQFVASGALRFNQTQPVEERGRASLWPRLSISPDMGSDGVIVLTSFFDSRLAGKR